MDKPNYTDIERLRRKTAELLEKAMLNLRLLAEMKRNGVSLREARKRTPNDTDTEASLKQVDFMVDRYITSIQSFEK